MLYMILFSISAHADGLGFVSVNQPGFDYAWLDPSKTKIWSDVILGNDGTAKEKNYPDAVTYCADRNAHIPTYDEFVQLRNDFGYNTSAGYQPQLFSTFGSGWVWGEEIAPSDGVDDAVAYIFETGDGELDSSPEDGPGAFMCVVNKDNVK